MPSPWGIRQDIESSGALGTCTWVGVPGQANLFFRMRDDLALKLIDIYLLQPLYQFNNYICVLAPSLLLSGRLPL